MFKICLTLLLTYMFLLAPSAGFAQEWWQDERAKKESPTRYSYEGQRENGIVKSTVDYGNRYLEFEAEGTVNMAEMNSQAQAMIAAKSAAKLRAYAGAAQFISGLMVTAGYKTDKVEFEEEAVTGILKGTLVKYARIINDDQLKWINGVPVATVKLGLLFDMSNGILETVFPAVKEQTFRLDIKPYQPTSSPPASTGPYTGVIIDARGLQLEPSIAPMILTENSRQVYGTLTVSRDYAVKQGIAGWYSDVEAAKEDTDRLGNNPLVIKGVKTAVTDHHVWISPEDAVKVYGADLKQQFLQECRVGIVVD